MDWEQIIAYILEAVAAAVIAVVIPYIAGLIKQKVKNDKLIKWIGIAEGIVTDSVLTIKQTFVDGLKQEGNFTSDKAQEAFDKAKKEILAQLTLDAQEAIKEAYGDIDAWIKTKIESNVSITKDITA